jgi:hypothetical protein
MLIQPPTRPTGIVDSGKPVLESVRPPQSLRIPDEKPYNPRPGDAATRIGSIRLRNRTKMQVANKRY